MLLSRESFHRKIQSEFATRAQSEGMLWNAISAFAAGAIACSMTQPFDTIKTHVQLQRTKTSSSLLRKRLLSNGPFGLFTGLLSRVASKIIFLSHHLDHLRTLDQQRRQ